MNAKSRMRVLENRDYEAKQVRLLPPCAVGNFIHHVTAISQTTDKFSSMGSNMVRQVANHVHFKGLQRLHASRSCHLTKRKAMTSMKT